MISVEDVTVSYGGFVLLDKINFHISETDKIGLVGKNGAGKSTILKLICGLQNPTSGRIDKPNDVTIGYLPQIMEHHKGLSVLSEAMTAFDDVSKIEAEIDGVTRELETRTDYESDSYSKLIEHLNNLNDRLELSHSEPPAVPCSAWVSATANLSATRRHSRRDGTCASNLPRYCSRSRRCFCSTSLPTIWT